MLRQCCSQFQEEQDINLEKNFWRALGVFIRLKVFPRIRQERVYQWFIDKLTQRRPLWPKTVYFRLELQKDNKFSRLSERERSKESALQAPKRGKHTILDQKSEFHNKRKSLISEISQTASTGTGASRRSANRKTLEMERQIIVSGLKKHITHILFHFIKVLNHKTLVK